MYTHPWLSYLTVYVDVFKMFGRQADVAKAWALAQEVAQLEKPTEQGRHLGCQHTGGTGDLVPAKAPSSELPGITASKEPKHRVRTLSYDRSDFVGQYVTSYLELADKEKSSVKEVPKQFLDESVAWEPPEGEPTGALAQVARKVLMKILYVARTAGRDLLRATG